MKKLAILILGMLMTIAFVAPASAGTGRLPVLRMAWTGDAPTALDSAFATDDPTLFILAQTMEGLVRQDAGGAIRKGSGAAEDWTVSADGLTYTFKLKEGLTWSDGKPLTSRDFAYAWFRALDPAKPGEYSYQLYYIKGAVKWASLDPKASGFKVWYDDYKDRVGIHTPDDRTLVVDLEGPAPFFLRLLTWPVCLPQRADLVSRYGDRYGTDISTMAFNGPFTVTDWQPGKSMRLQRNMQYRDHTAVPLDEIAVQFSRDEAGLVSQRDQGQLDMVKLNDGSAGQYQGRPDYRVEARETTQYLQFNLYKKYLANAHIRRALHLAIDREELAGKAYPGAARPAVGFVADGIHLGGVEFRAAVGELVPRHADPKGARGELLTGLTQLGLTELPPIALLATTTAVYDGPTAAIKRMWEENLGLTVTVTRVPFKTRTDRVNTGDYDVAYMGWTADYDDPYTFLGMFVTGGGWGNPSWSSATYDRVVSTSGHSNTLDTVYHMVNYALAERTLLQEVPVSPLLFPASASLRAPHVQGVIAIPTVPYLDLRQAWIVP